MRKTITIFILGAAVAVQGQQGGGSSMQPVNTQPNQTTAPRVVHVGNQFESGNFNTNAPRQHRPFKALMATNNQNENESAPTNQNQSSIQGGSTNTMSATSTNGMNNGSSQTVNASITNTLSAMSAGQANNVVQVQVGLNELQQLAVNIGNIQNVQQVIQQNPQVQLQLQKVQTQISGLAQGNVRPSDTIVSRLAEDLLRVNSQVQLSPDQQLIVAIVINQACNSGTMTSAQVQTSIDTALANLQNAGAPRSVSHVVGCDLHSIAFELQPNLGM